MFMKALYRGISGDALNFSRVRKARMSNTNDPDRFHAGLEPGERVLHPGQPDWGEGKIQSVVGSRVTVNFENVGKVLINARVVTLQSVDT